MKENALLIKSFAFALSIIRLYKKLVDQKEYVISKQILRSGTSIGANAEEANATISTDDFSFKIDLAYKEARETHYWLRLLGASGYIDKPTFETYLKDNEELKRILYAILKAPAEFELRGAQRPWKHYRTFRRVQSVKSDIAYCVLCIAY